jgi:hypothetical protein
MPRLTTTELEEENKALRALSIRIGRIVLDSIDAVSMLFNSSDNKQRVPPIFKANTPAEIVSALRDIAIEYDHLARNSARKSTRSDLEEISVELADKAANLEDVFKIPTGTK